jgi:hypothetical protein
MQTSLRASRSADVMNEAQGTPDEDIIKKALLLLDGEYNQVKMSMEANGFGTRCDEFDVLLMKLAASCSKTQQPNDVMKTFAILHLFFCSNNFRHLDVKKYRRPRYMEQVDKILSSIPGASRNLFSKYFTILDLIAGDAFKPSVIVKGWDVAGANPPPDVEWILSNCPKVPEQLTLQKFREWSHTPTPSAGRVCRPCSTTRTCVEPFPTSRWSTIWSRTLVQRWSSCVPPGRRQTQ